MLKFYHSLSIIRNPSGLFSGVVHFRICQTWNLKRFFESKDFLAILSSSSLFDLFVPVKYFHSSVHTHQQYNLFHVFLIVIALFTHILSDRSQNETYISVGNVEARLSGLAQTVCLLAGHWCAGLRTEHHCCWNVESPILQWSYCICV